MIKNNANLICLIPPIELSTPSDAAHFSSIFVSFFRSLKSFSFSFPVIYSSSSTIAH
jgi:hypothetical protein